MELTDKGIVAAVGVGVSIAGVFGTLITFILNRPSKGEVRQLSPDDVSNLREVVNSLASGHTRSQIDSAEIKKDIQHILEKMERFEEQREKDHIEVKKLSRILYPLLKEEIAAQRKKMGLSSDTDTGEMPATA